MREFQVNTGVYSAEYGRAAGAVINSVTKSGGNGFHGELLFNDLDRGFGAYDPGSVSPAGTPLKPKDLRKIYGGSMGGALIKDKLFWFYTYNQLTHINPGIGKAKSYGTAASVGGFLEQPDATVATCTLNTTTGAVTVTGATGHSALDAQVCALAYREGITYAAAVTAYSNGVTALLTDLGQVPRAGYQEINTPKLDWQVNSKNKASFLFHRLRWDAPGDVQTATSATYGLDAFGEDFVKLDYGVAKLESVVNGKTSNELLYQYGRELNDEGQQPYSPYTLSNLIASGGSVAGASNNIAGGTVPYVNLNVSNNGFYLGSPYYSYRLAYPDERKWQIEDVLYYQLGNHSLRMGGDFVHNNDILHQTPYYYGYFTYTSTVNFLSDLYSKGSVTSPGTCNSSGSGVGTATAGFYGCYSSATQDFGANAYEIATMDYAGFIQDNWKVTSQLTLEIGLRYDYQHLPAPTSPLTSAVFNSSNAQTYFPYTGLTNVPSDKNNLGPRLGFSYDLFGRGQTVVRGGYGIYYGRILNGMVATAQFGSGSPNGQYATASTKPTTGGAPTFPYPFASGGATKPSSFYLSQQMQNPQVHEIDMQLQQQLGKGTIVQASYLGVLGRQLPNYLDVNLAPAQDTEYISISGGPANGQRVAVPTFGDVHQRGHWLHVPDGIHQFELHQHHRGRQQCQLELQRVDGGDPEPLDPWDTVRWQLHLVARTGLQPERLLNHEYEQLAEPVWSGVTELWQLTIQRGQPFCRVCAVPVSEHGVLRDTGSISTNGWTVNDTFQVQNGLPYSAYRVRVNSTAALNSSWNGVPQRRLHYPHHRTEHLSSAAGDGRRSAAAEGIRHQRTMPTGAVGRHVQRCQPSELQHHGISTTAYNFGAQRQTSGLPAVGSQGNPAALTYVPQTGPGVGLVRIPPRTTAVSCIRLVRYNCRLA